MGLVLGAMWAVFVVLERPVTALTADGGCLERVPLWYCGRWSGGTSVVPAALARNERLLSWTGGGPPYRVQCAIDPVTGSWTDFLSNAVLPLTLPWTLPLRSTAQPAKEDDARPHFGHGLAEAVDPWNLWS